MAAGVEIPTREKRAIRPLTETEYRTVRDAVREDLRLAAIVEVFLQTGIRVGELIRLRLDDLTGSSRAPDGRRIPATLRICQAKGKRDREVVVNSVAEKALAHQLGHASVATTQQYVHVVRARLEALMEEHRL